MMSTLKPFLRLASRNLMRNRLRTAITLFAIVFGVASLIVSGGFVRDIFYQLGEALIHSQSGHVQIGRSAIFGHGSRTPERYLLSDPERIKARIAADPAVSDVMARITFTGLLNNGKTDYAIIADGMEPEPERRLGSHLRIVDGRALNGEDVFGVMLGEGVAQAMRLAPGDRATLLVSTLGGAMNTLDVQVVGVFQTFSKDFDARAIRLPLKAAQELLLTSGVGKLVVSLNATADTDTFVARIRADLPDGVEALDWRQLNDFYEKTVALYEQQFGFLQLMVLLMVCLSVVNTINMSILERSWEFGTMRAVGSRGVSIASVILTESTLLGVIGASLGAVLGMSVAGLVSSVGIPMPPPPNAEIGYDAFIRLVPSVIVQSWAVGLLATLIASIYPAYRTSRLPIVDALRSRA
ncbi:MAG: ABC transporter permease [Porticoccaceae bacterium]|nr:ABC transporter permease [Porticoccaceae bacterium]